MNRVQAVFARFWKQFLDQIWSILVSFLEGTRKPKMGQKGVIFARKCPSEGGCSILEAIFGPILVNFSFLFGADPKQKMDQKRSILVTFWPKNGPSGQLFGAKSGPILGPFWDQVRVPFQLWGKSQKVV